MSSGPAGQVTRSFNSPHLETTSRTSLRRFLRTVDGVTIDAAYDPGTGPSGDLAFIVAHGFTGELDRPHVRRAAGVLARNAAVVTFSFRGHGGSGGRSTVGDREVHDLAAAVAWARELGHTRIVTVGFSMGGSVVLRHAALYGGSAGERDGERDQEHEGRTDARTDAVVSVSAPARWYYRGTAPMRRVHWLVTRPEGRFVGRLGLRTRIHHRDWDPVPDSPVECVPRIAPTPLLIVHGDQDGYFPVDHPRMLAEASDGHAELWLEHGMGHAENAADDELLARIGDWAVAHAG
ncbi:MULTISPECIES: alpha/beta hydrolase [unclassified Streptomyces]|uniref:alpha/beta hydrolase family protein n=1 Tax=unclassified Streptomyces TaxID=2593676 RepID=UPI002E7FE118|nr:alpha/beta hydrolase [Streptomyces sp. NBC_00589]WTI38173.1 alpha/beta hydrolase [Streptomyces sp. NBC_00775]WUB28148.1 alpha/beta hydrolase [Streptomyces sp. NBC_00589]